MILLIVTLRREEGPRQIQLNQILANNSSLERSHGDHYYDTCLFSVTQILSFFVPIFPMENTDNIKLYGLINNGPFN